ncbi:ABC transporter ATP-binding protein [Fulvivirga ligni]|uniref:ABC transporter ATP-binding protein n=1 Tax=Fulvivirga ligni TaxID=2904246 RepID=UPI001F46C446|nr:ATP-binding cassette domain-containing protein [Fulvivirga ligni]UII21270.1 ATP-binding cassette domain-containing protein [Fulvivirga ligni]
MFKTKSLFFAYNSSVSFGFPDVCLRDGEDMLILGESGIGKTTFLHLMAGLLKPQSGTLELQGRQFQSLSSREIDKFRGRHIGLVYQKPHFIASLTLEENMRLVQRLSGASQDSDRILKVSTSLGIEHKLKVRSQKLSQGEQQRASIAMAVVNSPDLILADEPTSNLDDKNCERVASVKGAVSAADG